MKIGNAGGGFFNNFAVGAQNELAGKAYFENEYQAKADADIRAKVASVDPEAELNRRDYENQLQYQNELTKQKTALLGDIFTKTNLSPGDMPASTPQQIIDNAQQQVKPTITQPGQPLQTTGQPLPVNPFGQGTATMAPTDTSASSQEPVKPPMSPFEKAQNYRAASAMAHSVGLHDDAAGFEQMAIAQEKLDEHNKAESKVEPTPNKSAEGLNVNEQLLKEVDENKKVAGDSIYLPKEVSANTADDRVYKLDKLTAETIHTPLAQAEMAHQRQLTPDKPEDEVYGLVKNSTLVPTQDIVAMTVKDPRITPARQQAAMQDLMGYMKNTYGNDVDAAIKGDKNLQRVFTPKLLSTMKQLSNQGTTPSE